MPEWGVWLCIAILYLLMWFEFWISEDRQYLSNIYKTRPMNNYIAVVKNIQPKIKWKVTTCECHTEEITFLNKETSKIRMPSLKRVDSQVII